MKNKDLELLRLMKESAEEKCEYAITKWYKGDYSKDQEEIRKNIDEWKSRKNEIGELYLTLKDYIKTN